MKGFGALRRAVSLMGASRASLASDELFAIRPGAALASLNSCGPYVEQEEPRKPYLIQEGGIAVIPFVGMLSKHPSLFRMLGWTQQPTLRELTDAVRMAAADEAVTAIMAYVDSPGGTVAGTPEAAMALREARQSKPVHAYIQDKGCSAALWIAAQADFLWCSRAALVGAIGVYCVLVDASKAASLAGLKFHLVSSGPYKGAGAEPGVGITPDQLKDFQAEVDDIAGIFVADFAEGRQITRAEAEALADGRCYVGEKAVAAGLVDGVLTYAEALTRLAEQGGKPSARSGPATAPAPEEPTDDPTDTPDNPGEEEHAMSEPKPAASTAPTEEANLLQKIWNKLSGAEPAAAAPTPTAQVATGATAEEIAALVQAGVEARFQAAEVDRDLQALEGKVPPAILQNAETRALLLEAKAKGPERYKAALGLLVRVDASSLLGGPIASAELTGEAPAGLAVNSRELGALHALGLTDDDVKGIEQKYDLRRIN